MTNIGSSKAAWIDRDCVILKCPNTDFFLVRVFPYSDWIRRFKDQKKICFWTLFTQWDLPVGFLKDGANMLAKPISVLCNLSISQGVFPNACKVAKLKPIFKMGKKTDPSDCRPISLLTSVLMIIERVIHD